MKLKFENAFYKYIYTFQIYKKKKKNTFEDVKLPVQSGE